MTSPSFSNHRPFARVAGRAFSARGRPGIQRAADTECAREPTGAVHPLDPADKHGCRPICWTGDEVKHLVYAITDVDIPHTAGREHHLGAWSSAFACVTGEVTRAVVGLVFGDASPMHPARRGCVNAYKLFAQQPTFKCDGVPIAHLRRFDDARSVHFSPAATSANAASAAASAPSMSASV